MYLFHVAGLDLRKSLLQLQMLISSNKYQSVSKQYVSRVNSIMKSLNSIQSLD